MMNMVKNNIIFVYLPKNPKPEIVLEYLGKFSIDIEKAKTFY